MVGIIGAFIGFSLAACSSEVSSPVMASGHVFDKSTWENIHYSETVANTEGFKTLEQPEIR